VHYIELLAGLGAVQGVLLLSLILFRFRNHKNVPLAVLLMVFSVRLGTIPSWNPQTLIAAPWLFPATSTLPFLFAPLLWWYIRELESTGDATPPAFALHAAPYAVSTAAVGLILVGMSESAHAEFVEAVFAGRPPRWFLIVNAAKVAVNLLYLGLAARLAFGRGPGVVSRGRALWSKTMVIAAAAALAAFTVVAVDPTATARLAEGATGPFLLVAATMALLIYALSMLVLLAPDVPAAAGPRTHTSHSPVLDEKEALRLAARLRGELRRGIYRDPEITLGGLAERLHTHPNRLSIAVNQAFGLGCPQLLTRCRLDYFVRAVLTGALEDQNILELAFEAGFSSKSTFNRVFKAQYGVPPSVFARGAAKRRAPQTRLPSAAAGLATRTQRATMPVNGNGTNRSVQRHPDPAFARDARGHGRG
jgi:AraC-like DNA-binding protein